MRKPCSHTTGICRSPQSTYLIQRQSCSQNGFIEFTIYMTSHLVKLPQSWMTPVWNTFFRLGVFISAGANALNIVQRCSTAVTINERLFFESNFGEQARMKECLHSACLVTTRYSSNEDWFRGNVFGGSDEHAIKPTCARLAGSVGVGTPFGPIHRINICHVHWIGVWRNL